MNFRLFSGNEPTSTATKKKAKLLFFITQSNGPFNFYRSSFVDFHCSLGSQRSYLSTEKDFLLQKEFLIEIWWFWSPHAESCIVLSEIWWFIAKGGTSLKIAIVTMWFFWEATYGCASQMHPERSKMLFQRKRTVYSKPKWIDFPNCLFELFFLENILSKLLVLLYMTSNFYQISRMFKFKRILKHIQNPLGCLVSFES